MKVRTFFYNFKQGMVNIYRNKAFSIASIGTITACLFLFGIFYFVVENVKYMVESAEKSVSITVFFDGDTSAERKSEITDEISKRKEVNKVIYTSQEEAWENFKSDTFDDENADKMLTETFGDENPLKGFDSLEVKLSSTAVQDTLVEYVENMDGIRKVNYDVKLAQTFTSFKSIVAYVALAVMVLLLVVAIFLISITVLNGILVRSEEIRIMKLIGATDWFIKSPFMVEGITIGIVGAILPILLLLPMYKKIVGYILNKFGYVIPKSIEFLPIREVFNMLIPVSLAIGVGIGLIGTWLTLKRKLHTVI